MVFEPYEFHLSMQSLDPVSRDPSSQVQNYKLDWEHQFLQGYLKTDETAETGTATVIQKEHGLELRQTEV